MRYPNINMQEIGFSYDQDLSRTICALRFPLCILIVFVHFDLSMGFGIKGIKYGIDNPEWYYYIIRFVSVSLGSICVPLFFFISGFLFFYRKEFCCEIYKTSLIKRIKTLLIPYLVWNFIALLWKMKRFLPVISTFYQPAEIRFSLMRIFNTFFCNTEINGIVVNQTTFGIGPSAYPINGPLWYVRELMLMVIVSPLIFKLIDNKGRWFLFALSIVWFFSSILFSNGSYISLLIIALFFFSWGAYFSINRINFIHLLDRKWMLPIFYIFIVVVDMLTKDMNYNFVFTNVRILSGVCAFIIVVSYCLRTGMVKVNLLLSSSSFFIFALHQMILGDIARFVFVLFHIPGDNPYIMLLFYFVMPIFVTMICLVLYSFLRSFLPGICIILTGGRGS